LFTFAGFALARLAFAGFALGIYQQAANFIVGGIFSSVAVFTLFIVLLLAAPQGLFGAPTVRRV